jgi:outer membrane immunogenic protein
VTASKYVFSVFAALWLALAHAAAAEQQVPPGLTPDSARAAPLPPELRGYGPPAYPVDQAAPWAPSVPAYKAAVAPVAPAWSWTGVYLGLSLGAAWDHRDATISNVATGTFLASGSTHAANVAAGIQAGYNYAVTPNIVAGVEADLSITNLRNSTFGGTGFGERDNSIKEFGTVRGRVGYAWNSFVLLYGTGGFAWANEQIVRTQQVGTINNATPGTAESATATAPGWVAGAGVEWRLAQCWTARVEYLHLALSSQSFVFPLATQRIDASARIDTVRFGVNYKFD